MARRRVTANGIELAYDDLGEAGAPPAVLLHALGDVPALVVGRRTDVLAWTPMGHALLAGHLDPAAPEQPGQRRRQIGRDVERIDLGELLRKSAQREGLQHGRVDVAQ